MTRKFEPPESMHFVPEEIPSFVKAKTHHRKAEKVAEPHLAYLERWKGFEFLYRDVAPKAQKHDQFVFARDASEIDVIGACLAQMSRPRIDAILGLGEIGDLNVVLSRHNAQRLIGDNHLLEELDVTVQTWLTARKDLRFALKAKPIVGLKAVATMLLIVRAASDPKVKKTEHLVKDTAALEPAIRLLKDCVTHLIEHFQKEHDRFFQPSFRNPNPGMKV
jgi:hypothetical protein